LLHGINSIAQRRTAWLRYLRAEGWPANFSALRHWEVTGMSTLTDMSTLRNISTTVAPAVPAPFAFAADMSAVSASSASSAVYAIPAGAWSRGRHDEAKLDAQAAKAGRAVTPRGAPD
jgi:hypothetical protein